MSAFGNELRRFRDARGLSQLELSLRAEVSQRHVSFLETGRAQPSRRMISRLGAALDLPLRQQNRLFLTAGYAPVYGQTALADPQMGRVRSGLSFLLERHEPFPAFVLDRAWNIVMGNQAHRTMLELLQDAAGARARQPENALRLLFAPDALRPVIRDWPRLVRAVMARFERQLLLTAEDPELLALREEILGYPGVREALAESPDEESESLVLVPFEVEAGGRRLSWYTTVAAFGGAIDATTQELVIESLLPADEETEKFARALGGEIAPAARRAS